MVAVMVAVMVVAIVVVAVMTGMVVVVKVVVLMVVVELMVVVATFEGRRSRSNRCRTGNPHMRSQGRRRRRCHPRHTEELRCTCRRSLACSAHRRSPPSGRAKGCGRVEARTRCGPPICAKQIHGLAW